MINTPAGFNEAAKSLTRSSLCQVFFGVFDTTAAADAAITANTQKSFTNPQSLADGVRRLQNNIATFEPSYFKLDGSFSLTPDDVSAADGLGWWTNITSDGNGNFGATIPTITILFDDLHSSYGIGVIFDELGNNYAKDFSIEWYNGTTLLANTSVFGNTDIQKVVNTFVQNYNKLVLKFNSTNNPYRYIRVAEVQFGQEIAFDESKIVSATVVEEADPIGSKLSVNKLNVTVTNEDQKFNMLNPEGIYVFLQKQQPIEVRAGLLVGDSKQYVSMGKFYLDEWTNSTSITATLKAIDVIGLLDSVKFYNSRFYVNEPIANVLQDIVSNVPLAALKIASDVTNVINGYIPIMSCKEALQYVMVATNTMAVSDRDGKIKIAKADYVNSALDIDYSIILGEPTITQTPFVSGVEIEEFSYVLAGASEEVASITSNFSGTKDVYIEFDSAVDVNTMSIGITGQGSINGTPRKYATSAIVNVTASGNFAVSVTAKPYIETSKKFKLDVPALPVGETERVAKLNSNRLITSAGSVASNVLTYFSKRISQKFTYSCNPALQAGDTSNIETMFGEMKKGIIISQTFTLAPELEARLEVLG